MLSSSFGEYRDGHYHAGIDLRTFGRTGLPCLAIGNGSVSRIKIRPTGYGKALYLKLDDGRYAVYAHLDCFTRTLDSLTYYRRLDSGTSWCDISLPEGKFAFSVGDTVCFTGATGTEAPHLHFEMRDEGSRPINPLESFYGIPDVVPPIISGLEIVPLSHGSLVNGSSLPAKFLLRASGGTCYVLEDTLQLDGRFGFGASIWDEQGYGRFRMAPLSAELLIDGQVLYRLVNSVFSYDQTAEIALEYDFFGKGVAGRYSLFFKKPGVTRSDRDGPGVIHADEVSSEGLFIGMGAHRGEIVARDASGNESRASFHFFLHSYPVIDIAKKLVASSDVIVGSHDPDGGDVGGKLYESGDGGSTWTEVGLEPYGKFFRGEGVSGKQGVYRYEATDDEGALVSRYFASHRPIEVEDKSFFELIPQVMSGGFVLKVITDRILESIPDVRYEGGGTSGSCVIEQVGPREYSALFDYRELTDGVNLFLASGRDHRGYPVNSVSAFRILQIGSGESREFDLPGDLKCRIQARSLWRRLPCLISEVALPGGGVQGLRPVSHPFLIGFPADRLAAPLDLHCDPGDKIGLFRWAEDKGWKCAGVPELEGGSVKIYKAGVYAFFHDGLPPHIRHVAKETSHGGSGFYRPHFYYLPVDESGSGIDPYSAEVTLNGRKVVCEWDEFRGRLCIPIPASVPSGTAGLKVEISDKAGNRSVGEFSFMID